MEIFMPPKEVMTIQQIRDAYSSNDYNAELLLKHLLIRVAEMEEALRTVRDDPFGVSRSQLRAIDSVIPAEP